MKPRSVHDLRGLTLYTKITYLGSKTHRFDREYLICDSSVLTQQFTVVAVFLYVIM